MVGDLSPVLAIVVKLLGGTSPKRKRTAAVGTNANGSWGSASNDREVLLSYRRLDAILAWAWGAGGAKFNSYSSEFGAAGLEKFASETADELNKVNTKMCFKEALDKHRDAFSDRRRNSLISPFIDFSDNYRRASENSVQPMATEQLSTDASVQMVASGLKGAGFNAKTISSFVNAANAGAYDGGSDDDDDDDASLTKKRGKRSKKPKGGGGAGADAAAKAEAAKKAEAARKAEAAKKAEDQRKANAAAAAAFTDAASKPTNRTDLNNLVNNKMRDLGLQGNWPCLFKAMGSCSPRPGGKPCNKCDSASRLAPSDTIKEAIIGILKAVTPSGPNSASLKADIAKAIAEIGK